MCPVNKLPNLPGYRIDSVLHESERLQVFRGCRLPKGSPVIIKILRPEMCSSANIARLANEYEMNSRHPIPGVLTPIAFDRRGLALVMKDPGGLSLPAFLQGHMPGVSLLLDLFMQMAGILARIHQRGLIHGDLHPGLFIAAFPEETLAGQNPISDAAGTAPLAAPLLLLAGCGAALDRRQAEGVTGFQGRISGSLAYVSPEHSGRLSSGLDQRSDLYSLGIIAYEMFCRKLPFQADNPFAWMQAHLTRTPLPPARNEPQIPAMISAIIMTLMARNPADRYQDSQDLLEDLQECQRRLEQCQEIAPFVPVRGERPPGEESALRLYGLEQESALLQDLFESVCRDRLKCLVLISGAGGSGKTALVRESLQRRVSREGQFLYCQFNETEPGLSCRDLALNLERLARGSEPPHGQPGPRVLFLDDLQLAQPPVLQLLNGLDGSGSGDGASPGFMVVAAFSPAGEEDEPGLQEALEELGQGFPPPVQIQMEGLDMTAAGTLVAHLLAVPEFRVQQLSRIVHQRTGGNPLALEQLLQYAIQAGMLWVSRERGAWEWEAGGLPDICGEDDLTALLLKRLLSLPPRCHAYMSLAACLNSPFELNLLAALAGEETAEARSALEPALREGLLLEGDPLEKQDPFQRLMLNQQRPGLKSEDPRPDADANWRFAHESIRQAAALLLAEEKKAALHLQIGQLMWQRAGERLEPGDLFQLVDHLNRGRELLTGWPRRLELASWNLEAGRQALNHSMALLAWHYCRTGLELLPAIPGPEQAELHYQLLLAGARSAYISQEHLAARTLLREVKAEAPKGAGASLLYMQMELHAGAGRFDKGLQCGLEALEIMGARLPRQPGKGDLLKEAMLIKWRLRGNKGEKLLAAGGPGEALEKDDPLLRQTLETMFMASCCAGMDHPELQLLLSARAANLSLEKNCGFCAAPAYASAAQVLAAVTGDMEAARRVVALAQKQAGLSGSPAEKCLAAFWAGAFVLPWLAPVRKGLEQLRRCIDSGLETANTVFPGCSFMLLVENTWLAGESLDEALTVCQEAWSYARRHHQLALQSLAGIYRCLFSSLGGGPEWPAEDLNRASTGLGAGPGEDQPPGPRLRWTEGLAGMVRHYFQGEWEQARKCLDQITRSREQGQFQAGHLLAGMEFDLYHGLILAAAWEDLDRSSRNGAMNTLKGIQKAMAGRSDQCPENFLVQKLMIDAEIARLKGQEKRAERAYEQALEEARSRGKHYYTGLAAELAARHYLASGQAEVAGRHIQQAGQAFQAWGAIAKLRQLERVYPGWIS